MNTWQELWAVAGMRVTETHRILHVTGGEVVVIARSPTEKDAGLKSAPVFRPSAGTSLGLTETYNDWAKHYNACATCRAGDWYEPEAPCEKGARLFRRWVNLAAEGGSKRGKQE